MKKLSILFILLSCLSFSSMAFAHGCNTGGDTHHSETKHDQHNHN